jgi:hypothetical protein
MLAGLSGLYMRNTPPGFWGNAVPPPDSAISNAPATAAPRSLRFISLASLFYWSRPSAADRYLSSQTSSMRQPLKMLLTMVVQPLT